MPRQEKLRNLCRGRAVSGADSGAVLSRGRAQNGLVFESGSGGLFFFVSCPLSELTRIVITRKAVVVAAGKNRDFLPR